MSEQTAPRTHGGRRAGAGRPRSGRVSHHPRPSFSTPTPAHVVLRVREDVPSLRTPEHFAAIRRSFEAVLGKPAFRLLEFSVLENHLHLIVEADDSRALWKGMQGLGIRMAKALNKTLGRKGTLFDDHYDLHLLQDPGEAARAVEHVRTNVERHYGEPGVDYFSSAHPEWRALVSAR